MPQILFLIVWNKLWKNRWHPFSVIIKCVTLSHKYIKINYISTSDRSIYNINIIQHKFLIPMPRTLSFVCVGHLFASFEMQYHNYISLLVPQIFKMNHLILWRNDQLAHIMHQSAIVWFTWLLTTQDFELEDTLRQEQPISDSTHDIDITMDDDNKSDNSQKNEGN